MAHGKVEEDIALRSKSDFSSYTMTVNTDGLLLTAENDGSVKLKTADGETVFTVDVPWNGVASIDVKNNLYYYDGSFYSYWELVDYFRNEGIIQFQ